jgi:ankyrin repeat protein
VNSLGSIKLLLSQYKARPDDAVRGAHVPAVLPLQMVAIQSKDMESSYFATKELLAHGADPANTSTELGLRPFSCAIDAKNVRSFFVFCF